MFKELADKLRAKATKGKEDEKAKEGEPEKQEVEEVKDSEMAEVEVSMDKVISKHLDELPWVNNLLDNSSAVHKIVKGGCSTFDKHQTSLMHILSQLEGTEKSYKSLLDIFGGNKEVLLAVL